MAYLNGPATTTDFGVVEVGNNIIITDGVISLEQDVGPLASVNFYDISATDKIYQNGRQVVDAVNPTSGFGIALSGVTTSGPSTAFKITNTGVTTLTAGVGISLSGSTGNISISADGTSTINTVGTGSSYTANVADDYIGCTTSSAITITLPAGTPGKVYTIKDENGGSPKITVTGTSGEKIDNAATKSINIGYSSITVVFRAGQWHII
jgi:hypothetical protein